MDVKNLDLILKNLDLIYIIRKLLPYKLVAIACTLFLIFSLIVFFYTEGVNIVTMLLTLAFSVSILIWNLPLFYVYGFRVVYNVSESGGVLTIHYALRKERINIREITSMDIDKEVICIKTTDYVWTEKATHFRNKELFDSSASKMTNGLPEKQHQDQ